MMNKTELLAYEELKRRYGNDGVTRINRRGHPDFICGEDRYEVKKASGDKISFSGPQIKNFLPTDKIMVYQNDKLVAEFLWGERDKSGFKIVEPRLLDGVLLQLNLTDEQSQKIEHYKILKNFKNKEEAIADLIDDVEIEVHIRKGGHKSAEINFKQ